MHTNVVGAGRPYRSVAVNRASENGLTHGFEHPLPVVVPEFDETMDPISREVEEVCDLSKIVTWIERDGANDTMSLVSALPDQVVDFLQLV